MTARKTSPSAAEALATSVPFTHNGVDYELAPTSEWDYEVLEAFEEGRIVAFLRGVLGKAQHDAFKATKPKLNEVNGFVAAIQKALGIQGN